MIPSSPTSPRVASKRRFETAVAAVMTISFCRAASFSASSWSTASENSRSRGGGIGNHPGLDRSQGDSAKVGTKWEHSWPRRRCGPATDASGSQGAGNRDLVAAWHRIAVAQGRSNPRGHAYLGSRCAAGRARTEVIQALKRRRSDRSGRELVIPWLHATLDKSVRIFAVDPNFPQRR